MSTFRILLAAFILTVGVPDVRWTSTLADGMFTPPFGPMMLFTGIPSLAWTTLLLWSTYACAVWFLWGKGERWSGLTLSVLLAVGFGLESSFGKINHATPYFILPAVVGWQGTWKRAPLYYLVVLAFQFFTAAMPKIVGGWLQPQTHAAYGYAVETMTIQQSPALLTQWAVTTLPGWFWEMADVITVAFEALFIVAMWRRRSLALICFVALAFHIGVWFTLHIPATGYVACYAYIWLAFLAPRTLADIPPQRILVLTIAAAFYAALRAWLSPIGLLETLGLPFTEEVENTVIMALGGGTLMWLYGRAFLRTEVP
ncbi:MAG: hypothetical protein JSS89_03525 [Bacteroidetes bacterium]|nr:hypothetical protein [Bacteroidota bacterium]